MQTYTDIFHNSRRKPQRNDTTAHVDGVVPDGLSQASSPVSHPMGGPRDARESDHEYWYIETGGFRSSARPPASTPSLSSIPPDACVPGARDTYLEPVRRTSDYSYLVVSTFSGIIH